MLKEKEPQAAQQAAGRAGVETQVLVSQLSERPHPAQEQLQESQCAQDEPPAPQGQGAESSSSLYQSGLRSVSYSLCCYLPVSPQPRYSGLAEHKAIIITALLSVFIVSGFYCLLPGIPAAGLGASSSLSCWPKYSSKPCSRSASKIPLLGHPKETQSSYLCLA